MPLFAEKPLSANLFVPSVTLPPGIHLPCYGPFRPPAGARSLEGFLPVVNMSIVHHMILFGGAGTPYGARGSEVALSPSLCGSGRIVYAWARTGQTSPLSLDLKQSGSGSDAFPVGPGTPTEWFALQVHYQQLHHAPVRDTSGVQLSFSSRAPRRPLAVQLMASGRVKIPPRVIIEECLTCRAAAGGTAVAWRNHAHRLGRDVWSEHFDSHGNPKPHIGRISAQEPQIFRLLPRPVTIAKGDTLQLHCEYDARAMDKPTFVGVDERTHEMCNQYLMATTGFSLHCDDEHLSRSAAHDSRFAQPTGGVGQVTGVAVDERASLVYIIHRGSNSFDSTTTMAEPAILALDYDGRPRRSLAPKTFIVPHGLTVDHHGRLWATDVAAHKVVRLDATTGRIELTLGSGAASPGRNGFNKPTGVAVCRSTAKGGGGGEVYVSDGYGNSRVIVFAYDGTYLREWGSAGSAGGQFNIPHAIVLDKRGLVYVADRENGRVQIFDKTGQYKGEWVSRVRASTSSEPWDRHVGSITYSESLDLFAVVEGSGVVLRTSSGCEVTQAHGGLRWPHDVALLPTPVAQGKHDPNRTAMASGEPTDQLYTLFIAELQGKRLARFDSVKLQVGRGRAPGPNPYG